jgi:hypothetical protein
MFILLRQLATIRRQTHLPPGSSRWLAIRHVDAGSCNGCEHELGAVSNPFHDLQRHGLDIVASPWKATLALAATKRCRIAQGPTFVCRGRRIRACRIPTPLLFLTPGRSSRRGLGEPGDAGANPAPRSLTQAEP